MRNVATTARGREQDTWLPSWLAEHARTAAGHRDTDPNPAPERYRIKDGADGEVLTCVEAPTIRVRVRHGFSVTATAARSAAPGSIFLDGAALGEPFLDTKRQIYNLDHHEGCVRAFTMATCEQAMVLLLRGLDLRKRDWTVYANDADLDTVLAIWVLVNHIRLNESPQARMRVMPLVRLQGVIDAQGLELQDLCGFPPEQLATMQGWLAALREREVEVKARRGWRELDLLKYTAGVLHALDTLVYPEQQFDRVEEIEELARVEIANDSVAIVCRSTVGIYEVERQLRRLHGKRLGVVALQKDDATYSLRQVDPYLPTTLDDVYAHLNLIDSAAGGPRSANRWGGSAEIGGSPRGSGTRVTPEQLAVVCQQAFGTPTLLQRLYRLAGAVFRNACLMVAVLAWVFVLTILGNRIGVPGELSPNPAGEFAIVLAAVGVGLILRRGLRPRGLYGLRRPGGLAWWMLLPVAVTGAVCGGVWLPIVRFPNAAHPVPGWYEVTALLTLPVAAEVVFRGLLLGGLVTTFPIHKRVPPWFLSWPVLLSAGLYSLWGTVLQHPSINLMHATPVVSGFGVSHLGALVFGVAAGMARERSESVASSILFHWICVAAVVFLQGWCLQV